MAKAADSLVRAGLPRKAYRLDGVKTIGKQKRNADRKESCRITDAFLPARACSRCYGRGILRQGMNIREDSVLITCAVRYALGRQSYMPSAVINEIYHLLPKMSTRNLIVMYRDITEYIKRVRDDWNLNYWGNLLVDVGKEIERREQCDTNN